MGYSFYHIFTTPYLFLSTLFFGRRGVGIHNVITKNYHMSIITVISRKFRSFSRIFHSYRDVIWRHHLCQLRAENLNLCLVAGWVFIMQYAVLSEGLSYLVTLFDKHGVLGTTIKEKIMSLVHKIR
jgi:hypothetical protein